MSEIILARGSSAVPTLIFRPASFFRPLELGEIFSDTTRLLEVELGAGDGSFLARYAGMHPERNFFGVERLLGRLRKLDRKGVRAGLKNLRLIRVEAGYFLEYLLPKNSVAAVHLYFPDPWPKRRHWKNRLVNERFPELARSVLRPGGRVYLRTDHGSYYEQMTAVFGVRDDFERVPAPAELLAVETDFEREFRARGVAAFEVAYQLRG